MRRRLLPLISKQESYAQQILKTNPICYWPLNETSGTAANNYGNLSTGANGTYVGVTLSNALAPGGGMCPLWDAVNDRVAISSATLLAGLNTREFTFLVWAKVTNSSVWTDGVERSFFYIGYNSNPGTNFFSFNKRTTANQIQMIRYANGPASTKNRACSLTDWFLYGGTISESANQFISYLNGVGDTPIGTGTFTGTSFISNQQNIGSVTNAIGGFSGWLAHAMLWDRALTSTEITAIYNGGL